MLHSQLYDNISGKAHFSSTEITAPFPHRGLHRRGLTKWVFKKLNWPSKSPDLNPIEHLWDESERRLRSQPNRPSSLQAFTSTVMDARKAIPMVTYQKLVESLPKRVQAVIQGAPSS
ncbi:QLQ domain-containing protein [Trichonephila clavipes]|nr:QLQ domain-containing protein [Trichonephila clavipes]